MIGATPPSSICRGARRRLCGFAPHTRKSLISPLRGANFLQGRGAVAAGVCASLPGKAYSSVERRKPFAGKSPRRQCEFAPPLPGKPYSSVERRKPFAGKRRRQLC